jgi:hypothetical protein
MTNSQIMVTFFQWLLTTHRPLWVELLTSVNPCRKWKFGSTSNLLLMTLLSEAGCSLYPEICTHRKTKQPCSLKHQVGLFSDLSTRARLIPPYWKKGFLVSTYQLLFHYETPNSHLQLIYRATIMVWIWTYAGAKPTTWLTQSCKLTRY